jgi:ubiquinone/menaquinone biosynthesis C-methylase UbiE
MIVDPKCLARSNRGSSWMVVGWWSMLSTNMKTTSQTSATCVGPGSNGPPRICVEERYRGYVDPWNQEELTWRGLSDDDGALVRPDGHAYPVRGGVARFVNDRDPTDDWILDRLGVVRASGGDAQSQESVDSFGFQWTWDNNPRTEEDLLWRVAERFNLAPSAFSGKRVLDAGCGAGAQSKFLAQSEAVVSAVDLSSAINSAARAPELRRAHLAQADIAHLPFRPGSFEIVYCEGVLQHTAAIEPILAEFARVLEPGGLLLATHYPSPQGLLRTIRLSMQEWLRGRAQQIPRDWLFLASGLAAVAALSPGIGWLLRKTIVPCNPRMLNLKATWSNVYDSYGQHSFQRNLPSEQFVASVRSAGFGRIDVLEAGVVRAER